MNLPEKYPDHLATVALTITEALQRDGIDPARADEIAFAATEKVRFEHGGDTSYIPKGHLYQVLTEWREIYDAWANQSVEVDELRRRYDLTERHLRRIIAWGRNERVKRDQLTLEL